MSTIKLFTATAVAVLLARPTMAGPIEGNTKIIETIECHMKYEAQRILPTFFTIDYKKHKVFRDYNLPMRWPDEFYFVVTTEDTLTFYEKDMVWSQGFETGPPIDINKKESLDMSLRRHTFNRKDKTMYVLSRGLTNWGNGSEAAGKIRYYQNESLYSCRNI